MQRLVGDFSLDRSSPVSGSYRVEEWLAQRIGCNELRLGTRLPSERKLTKRLGISHMTLRRADHLERDRPPGDGVTVAGRATTQASQLESSRFGTVIAEWTSDFADGCERSVTREVHRLILVMNRRRADARPRA